MIAILIVTLIIILNCLLIIVLIGLVLSHLISRGSEEGFKPSAFVSSRTQRASRKEQSVNDFVDSEDGLLGGVLTAKDVRNIITVCCVYIIVYYDLFYVLLKMDCWEEC